jgi:predicted class III extradiol MEMO1 family dioxygenase
MDRKSLVVQGLEHSVEMMLISLREVRDGATHQLGEVVLCLCRRQTTHARLRAHAISKMINVS